jgi:hypothetical protein
MWVGINEVSSIPAIYGRCENLNSSSVYSGVYVSTTYPCRGYDDYAFENHIRYSKHGESDVIFNTLYQILYNREKKYWCNYLNTTSGVSLFATQLRDYDLSTSLANSSFELSSFSLYEDFQFSSLHKLYNDWVLYFNREQINLRSLELSGGKDIFSHTYGPLIHNGKFDYEGSAVITSAALIASALNEGYFLGYGAGSGVLSYHGSSVGTQQVNDTVFGKEFRNKHILSGVELTITSATNSINGFEIYNVNPLNADSGGSNYLIDNPIVKAKAKDGFPRMIFHFSSLGNVLIPNHEFSLDLKFFAGFESGNKYGGATVGVWIHTEPENNIIWNWTKNNKWEPLTLTSSITYNEMKQYFWTKTLPLADIPEEKVKGFVGKCYNSDTDTGSVLTLKNINESMFEVLNLTFNTKNKYIEVPNSYFIINKQVHRQNQNYVIEIFKIKGIDENSYVIFDELNIKDLTLNNYAQEVEPDKLLNILNYFKSIANGRASRNATITSGTFYTSGGSRLNYRSHTAWYNPTVDTYNRITNVTIAE